MIGRIWGKDRAHGDSRRRFLMWMWWGLGGIAIGEFTWIVVSFLRPSRTQWDRSEGASRVWGVGRIEEFSPGTVTAFPRGRFYLVRLQGGGFLALSPVCTHLGCTVAWVEKDRRFVCPCHASAFDIMGGVIHAPAPRALDTLPVRIENNLVQVDARKRMPRAGFDGSQVTYPRKM